MLQVFAFPAELGYIPEPRGRAPGPLESAARWHRALAFPRQHAQLSLNEIRLSSLWADPTQQQFCNTCCSHIYHLNPQITFGNCLGNCQPFLPMGISSEELSQLLLGRFLWRSSGVTSQLHQQENSQHWMRSATALSSQHSEASEVFQESSKNGDSTTSPASTATLSTRFS